jgi:hypothetical protein
METTMKIIFTLIALLPCLVFAAEHGGEPAKAGAGGSASAEHAGEAAMEKKHKMEHAKADGKEHGGEAAKVKQSSEHAGEAAKAKQSSEHAGEAANEKSESH